MGLPCNFSSFLESIRYELKKANVLFLLTFKSDIGEVVGEIELGMAFALNIPIVIYTERPIHGDVKGADNIYMYDDLQAAIAKANELDKIDTTRYVFDQLKKEITYQENKWGGIPHDVAKSQRDWFFFYDRYLADAKNADWDYRPKDTFSNQLMIASMIICNLRANYCPDVSDDGCGHRIFKDGVFYKDQK